MTVKCTICGKVIYEVNTSADVFLRGMEATAAIIQHLKSEHSKEDEMNKLAEKVRDTSFSMLCDGLDNYIEPKLGKVVENCAAIP